MLPLPVKIDFGEMLRKRRGVTYVDHLPCAGITLFRFYGYYLSRNVQHPGELIRKREVKDI